MQTSQFGDAVANYRAAQNSWARSQLVEDVIALSPSDVVREWALTAAAETPTETLAACVLGDLAERAGNLAEARDWFRTAAQHDDFYAYASLASIELEHGEVSDAIPLLQRAAELGDPETMVCLGAYFSESSKPDFARQWWAKAANLGVSKAMVYLGLLAEEQADLPEAQAWLRKAAVAGNVLGMNLLGNMLYDAGEISEARQWYQRAASLGDLNAIFNMEDIEESLKAQSSAQILSERGDAGLEVAA